MVPKKEPRGQAEPSPIMAQNSDAISDSDTVQLFVLHVLTLSQLYIKIKKANNCHDKMYEIGQKVIRRKRNTNPPANNACHNGSAHILT